MSPKRQSRIKKVSELAKLWGVHLSTEPVCVGHSCTADIVTSLWLDRPPILLIHGARGAGKSFGAAWGTHMDSMMYPSHGTKILGGSMSQSGQIYDALREFDHRRPDKSPFTAFTRTKASYYNGSDVEILAASATAVRGPHVPSVKLDEVDEIDEDIREQATGIPMTRHGVSASLVMLSTWHKVAGPMSGLIRKAESGQFPYHKFCILDVLERCPDSRSGKNLEGCESCLLKPFCHEDRHLHPQNLPKAKRSNGHYKIDDLIQKVQLLSLRVFESDFLCSRPKSSGVWFTEFDERVHVSDKAEYHRGFNFHVSIDPGVHTGAVWFQTHQSSDGTMVECNVFGDYYAEELSAEANAIAIQKRTYELCGIGLHNAMVSIDPQANQKTGIGPTIRGEYERMDCKGSRGLKAWPAGEAHPKQDALALIEALLKTADGKSHLKIHSRCQHLKNAFQSYVRAERDGQLMDYPKDPQHPQENLIDSLAGGLKLEFPKGRTEKPKFRDIHAADI